MPLFVSCNSSNEDFVPSEEYLSIKMDDDHLSYIGRHLMIEQNLYIEYSASGFSLKVNVTNPINELNITLDSIFSYSRPGYSASHQYAMVNIDNSNYQRISFNYGENNNIPLFSNISIGEHIISFKKSNEAAMSNMLIKGLSYRGFELLEYEDNRPLIEIYGDSITCGYGNLANNNQEGFTLESEEANLSYADLLAEMIDYRSSLISFSGIAIAKSPFNSPITMMDKYNTIKGLYYDMNQDKRDIVILNLGTNDNTTIASLDGEDKQGALTLFHDNYLSLIETFISLNNECKIIICYDMMVNLDDSLVDIIVSLDEQYDNVYSKRFICDISGADGHPGWGSHINNALELVNFINNIEN